jgi:hypothetical protein
MTKDLVKLNNVDHASQRVVTEFGAQWGDNQMTCLAHTAEMRTLQGTYPILFQSTADAEYPLPVALMGFETGENLFLSGAGWREPVIPMMMRKGPFYIASEGSTAGTFQSVIAMDQSHPKVKNNTGEPLFLEHGGHSPYLEKIVQLLERIEASHPHTLAFAKTLNEMSLITPIDLKVTDKEGAPHTLSGFFGIDEERVLALSGEALSQLSEAGYLAPLFMVIASQSQLSRLLELKNG